MGNRRDDDDDEIEKNELGPLLALLRLSVVGAGGGDGEGRQPPKDPQKRIRHTFYADDDAAISRRHPAHRRR